MDKRTNINISYTGLKPNTEAIEEAFLWTGTQMKAVDLENADYASAGITLPSGVRIDFSLNDVTEQPEEPTAAG